MFEKKTNDSMLLEYNKTPSRVETRHF